MQSIKEILEHPTNYTGSQTTRDMVKAEIAARWGAEEAEKYDPLYNARTFRQWLALGLRVKKGEKGIRSITFVEKKDENGKVTERIRRSIVLFYYKQVEKIS